MPMVETAVPTTDTTSTAGAVAAATIPLPRRGSSVSENSPVDCSQRERADRPPGKGAGVAGDGVVSATASTTNAAPADFEPKILAFACHWCTYSGADLAGLNRMNYPANVRVLRVPCSGRVNPQHVLAALNRGVDGVLVCGCHPGDCHYVSGNYFAKRRLMAFKRLLEYTGLEPERFQVRWISGSEAGKFRDTVISVCEQIRKLGPYVPDPTAGQGSGAGPLPRPQHSEGGDAQ